MELPNYQVFDEKRYFVAGERPCVVEIEGFRVALSVCEDIWHESPTALAVAEGAELGAQHQRLAVSSRQARRGAARIVERRAVAGGVGVVYVNQVAARAGLGVRRRLDGDSARRQPGRAGAAFRARPVPGAHRA